MRCLPHEDSSVLGERTDRPSHSRKSQAGFTLRDLGFLVGSVGLLTLITLPLLGMNKPRSERLLCMNNLRQIGIAFHTWSDSVEDKLPWQVRVEDGGTAG